MIKEKVVGTNVLQFKEKKVELPYKIYDSIISDKYVIVLIVGYLPDNIKMRTSYITSPDFDIETLKIINDHLAIINQNIWCFDFEGNLLWKIPKAYKEEVDRKEKERVGHPYVTQYVSMKIEAENVLQAWTAFGNIIRVNLNDGTMISRTEGSK